MITYSSEVKDVEKLGSPCRCSACENGCKYGSGVMLDEDIVKLARHLNVDEGTLKKEYLEEVTRFNTTLLRPKQKRKEGMPYGSCIFYDRGCKIHEAKPTECRLAMSCKPYGPDIIAWFNIKFFVDPEDPESARQYKLYLDSGGSKIEGADYEHIIGLDVRKKAEGYEDLKDDTDWEKKLGVKDE